EQNMKRNFLERREPIVQAKPSPYKLPLLHDPEFREKLSEGDCGFNVIDLHNPRERHFGEIRFFRLPLLSQNMICSPGWPRLRDLSASAFPVLGLKTMRTCGLLPGWYGLTSQDLLTALQMFQNPDQLQDNWLKDEASQTAPVKIGASS
ncbi:hypothetical protein STEG23_026196, partial [Scotinomys teguina]